ncbi:MAG: hypothetical protein QOC66_2720 [Pseudonocardiales bacterium]|jgi:hypothetical protein|nr:hypothetical protein [Pseudonocardiales bacterium]
MTTTVPSTDVVVSIEPLFSDGERIALAGFLAGYSGLTRDAYALDLRQYVSRCQQRGLHLFQARRADIECSVGIWKPRVGRGRRSLGGCAPSRGSTATPSRKNYSTTHPPSTCGGRGWITSRTRSGWTAPRAQ